MNTATAKYCVESVESNQMPERGATYLGQGEFDTYEEALACAKRVVQKSTKRMVKSGMTAKHLASLYSTYGDVPMIHGEPRTPFNPYHYAQEVVIPA